MQFYFCRPALAVDSLATDVRCIESHSRQIASATKDLRATIRDKGIEVSRPDKFGMPSFHESRQSNVPERWFGPGYLRIYVSSPVCFAWIYCLKKNGIFFWRVWVRKRLLTSYEVLNLPSDRWVREVCYRVQGDAPLTDI
ncbi:hypothetical protein A9320_11645 [Ruegeria sp. PBVC088]|nr:hypothetical protein A9320_11645 [Ruegeria sp. PBVC088]